MPDIISRGFVYMRDSEKLMDSAREHILKSLATGDRRGHGGSDWSFIKDKIKHSLSEFLFEQTRRRPMILPIVVEV